LLPSVIDDDYYYNDYYYYHLNDRAQKRGKKRSSRPKHFWMILMPKTPMLRMHFSLMVGGWVKADSFDG